MLLFCTAAGETILRFFVVKTGKKKAGGPKKKTTQKSKKSRKDPVENGKELASDSEDDTVNPETAGEEPGSNADADRKFDVIKRISLPKDLLAFSQRGKVKTVFVTSPSGYVSAENWPIVMDVFQEEWLKRTSLGDIANPRAEYSRQVNTPESPTLAALDVAELTDSTMLKEVLREVQLAETADQSSAQSVQTPRRRPGSTAQEEGSAPPVGSSRGRKRRSPEVEEEATNDEVIEPASSQPQEKRQRVEGKQTPQPKPPKPPKAGLHCFVFMDNLASHRNPEVVKKMLEGNIFCLWLPKNSTHITQPLDAEIYATFKRAVERFNKERVRVARAASGKSHLPTKTRTSMVWRSVFDACLVALKPEVVQKAWSTVHLWPWDEADFVEHVKQALGVTPLPQHLRDADTVANLLTELKLDAQRAVELDDSKHVDLDNIRVPLNEPHTCHQLVAIVKLRELEQREAAEAKAAKDAAAAEARKQRADEDEEKRQQKLARTCSVVFRHKRCEHYFKSVAKPPKSWWVCPSRDPSGQPCTFNLCPQGKHNTPYRRSQHTQSHVQ
jgi:hypothetical protein